MNRFSFSLLLSVCLVIVNTAEATAPVVSNQIADYTAYAGAPARSIDLSTAFSDPDATSAVRMETVLGTMDVILYGQQKPITVANFLNYVNSGRYFKSDPATGQLAPSFIHRSVPGFVIQGGGFLATTDPTDSTHTNAQATQVAVFSPIQNEPGIPNTRGTIAMAKTSDPNSATSQWFINLANNTSLDDPANSGGFTVFGRVAGNGMGIADAIAALPRYNFGAPFGELPLRNYTSPNPVKVSNLISIPGIAQISPLTFSASSNNTTVATVAVSGTRLLVTGKTVGRATITVTATDLDGAAVSQTFTVNVIAAPGRFVNISTRLQVGTGDNVLIGGFIVRGTASKRLVVRGIGPSLAANGISNPLADPILELHNASTTLATNDNWQTAPNQQDVSDIGLAPASASEAAILATVPANSDGIPYTVILRGVNDQTGVGLVEVYDVDNGPGSTILNISTRGRVDLNDNVMIGGFFVGGTESKRILVRGIGPSLTAAGVIGALADPTIDLRDSQGNPIESNNDWQSAPNASDIQASGLAPTNPKESAVLRTLAPGAYTAILRGANNTAGVALVEAYQLP